MDIPFIFLSLPTAGHDFQWVTVTQKIRKFQIPRCQLKDIDIAFPEIPFG